MDRRSDAELIEICNDGSAREAARAFEVLYRRHKDFVLRVAFRYLRDADGALDVLQETFTYLLRKFPPTGSGLRLDAKLTTLLYPAARNSAISILRKTARTGPSEALDPDDLPAADTERQTGRLGDLDVLLKGLSAERREVIMLRFVDDMSLADIAEALGIPLGTVKSRLHLAIKDLRNSPELIEYFDS